MVRSQQWSKARAPVSGGDERTEGGRERNNTKAEQTLRKKPHTKYSHDVRGKAKGEFCGVSGALVFCDGSIGSCHSSDVQCKMAWFARFSESALCFFRK